MIKPPEERDRILFGDAVISELRQFHRLVELDPPISSREIAHRMAWSRRNTRWMLTKIGDRRD